MRNEVGIVALTVEINFQGRFTGRIMQEAAKLVNQREMAIVVVRRTNHFIVKMTGSGACYSFIVDLHTQVHNRIDMISARRSVIPTELCTIGGVLIPLSGRERPATYVICDYQARLNQCQFARRLCFVGSYVIESPA